MPDTPPFRSLFLVMLFFSQIQLKTCSGASILELNPVKTGELDAIVKRVRAEKVGECSEAELKMESESSRRILLMQKRYISYDTLKKDLVPCEDPGVSYYNCGGSGVANHYSRGCEVITRCARGD
ncbi:protein RALF-like 24 [Henckelia pumila]|uniref:protein RALF-like 24 n=1 Tax=Henckelia pumila TaxID=405737 RepID=UPI003C6E958C